MKDFFLVLVLFMAFNLSYSQGLLLTKINGKVGVNGSTGKTVLPAEFDEIGWSPGKISFGNLIKVKNGNYWQLFDLSQRKFTHRNLLHAEILKKNILITSNSKLSYRVASGLIDSTGREILPMEFEGIKPAGALWIVFTRIGNEYKFGLYNESEKSFALPQVYKNLTPVGPLFLATAQDGKSGLFNGLGQALSPMNIDSTQQLSDNAFIIYRNGLCGLLDASGKEVIPTEYKQIKVTSNGIDAVRPNKWLFVTKGNQVVREVIADSVAEAGKNLFYKYWNHKVWLLNRNGETISGQTYDAATPFEGNYAAARVKNKWGIIDQSGKWLVAPQFFKLKLVNNSWAGETSHGWILLRNPDLQILPKVYQTISAWNDSLYLVVASKLMGLIDLQGKPVINPGYDSILEQKGTLLAVKFNQQFGIIDLKERWMLAPQRGRIQLVNDSSYLERNDPYWVIRDLNRMIHYFTTNSLKPFRNYVLEATSSGPILRDRDGYTVQLNQAGAEVMKAIPAKPGMTEGLQIIYQQNRYGFIDSRGRLRIANRYEGARPFKEGLAAIKIRGRWGFISHEDALVIQPNYDSVSDFTAGRSVVRRKDAWGMIDLAGKPVLQIRYQEISTSTSGNLRIRENGLIGMASTSGTVTIQPKYLELSDPGTGNYIVRIGDQWGVISADGLSIIPAIYKGIEYLPDLELYSCRLGAMTDHFKLK